MRQRTPILSTVHLTHAALADLFKNFVVADGGAEQCLLPQDCVTRLSVDSRPSGGLKAMEIDRWESGFRIVVPPLQGSAGQIPDEPAT